MRRPRLVCTTLQRHLLVGRSGVGRRSLVSLIAHMQRLTVFSPATSRKYDDKKWKRDLKQNMRWRASNNSTVNWPDELWSRSSSKSTCLTLRWAVTLPFRECGETLRLTGHRTECPFQFFFARSPLGLVSLKSGSGITFHIKKCSWKSVEAHSREI